MKKILLLLLVFGCISINAQVPQGFNYQAVARDASKNPITTTIAARFTVQSDSLGGTVFWVEEHTGITPDEFGVFTAVIGKGTRKSGLAKFSDIDWTVSPKFIKTEINHLGWKTLGSTRLHTVPYSMVAGDIGGSLDKLKVKGQTSENDSVLFEVKNKNGQTVFAVYNEGVRIYVGDGNTNTKGTKGGFAVSSMVNSKTEPPNFLYVSKDSIRAYVFDDPAGKAVKGGFAVSGFNNSKKQTNDYLLVSPDSVRIFIDKAPDTKAQKGGFAVSGYGNAKALNEEYLRVTRDSTRISVNEDPAKAVKGGFAIGGFANAKGPVTTFTSLTPQNYLIGHESGMSITTGLHNSFFGYNAGRSNTTGSFNIFIGEKSGYSNTSGWANIFMGDSAGFKNTSGFQNLFLGPWTGQENTTGYRNILLGYAAGVYNTSGYQNIYIGHYAGLSNSGSKNTFIGSGAGMNASTTRQSIFIGDAAGQMCIGGENNVYVGIATGKMNLYGSNNVALGLFAGYYETGSNTLYIDNQKRANELDGKNKSLIYGVFNANPDLQYLTINANVGIGTITPACKLQVGVLGDGSVARANAWNLLSDESLKTDFTRPENAMLMLNELNGYYFYWKSAPDRSRQFGLSAQEVERVLPEIVTRGEDGLLSLDYGKLTPLLVEVAKEQQKQIESGKSEIIDLKSQIEALQEKIAQIEALLEKSADD